MVRRLLVLQFISFFLVTFVISLASSARTAEAAAPPGPFFQGFEKNRDGWFDSTNGGIGTLVRRMSGYSNGGGYADDINSSERRWHARLTGECSTPLENCSGPFTRWGGYTSTFPPGGYLTEVDIYLDVAWTSTRPDVRFDWSSAINSTQTTGLCSNGSPPPCHRRDWVFNVGTRLATDPPGFWVNASTNAFRPSSFPSNPCPAPTDPLSNPPAGCRDPKFISQSGWYTFRHTFRAGLFPGCPESTCLIVDFDIFKRNGAQVAHWTIHAPFDPMSMVGGNRYGWFANEEIPELPIDASLRTGLCRKGEGDGEFEDKDGKKHHAKFHGKSCDKDDGDVEDDERDSGKLFQSSSVMSATFTSDEDMQTLTMIGTGLDDGLPVGFTMVAVDYGSLAPPIFTLTLTNGRTFTGTLVSGSLTLE